MTLALAARLIGEMGLGKGRASDIIAIGLSATDYVGHTYGNGGGEMCLQMHSLDRDLGDFLALMDRSGIDYAVDAHRRPWRARHPRARRGSRAWPTAKRSRPDLTAAAIGKAIGAQLGLAGPVLIGEGAHGDIYLDTRAEPRRPPPRAGRRARRLSRRSRRSRRCSPGTNWRGSRCRRSSPDRWSLIERVRAGFDPTRSGDLVVLLKRDITPIPNPSGGYVATHGSPWDYDRRVPILFWRPGIARNERPEHVATVDIMPTLAAMLGAAGRCQPTIDGRCLASAARRDLSRALGF